MKFSWTPIPVCIGGYIPYFKINAHIFYSPLIFEPQVKINKIITKHAVYYQPSPSQLTSRIHPFIYGLPRGLSLQNLS